ncbi:unnamed protein product [Oikopleura dioica]|uniref:tRNA pseudouridine synthase n=1 Tax=Oikopleura dioica TaxID=34765 RepID=E4X5C1_OIKDI|nr:unnamed protein product [Oikopleura dioica]
MSKEELHAKLEKMKKKNAQLSDQISQMKVKIAQSGLENEEEPPAKKKKKTQKGEKEQNDQIFRKRKIALRFSYDGTKYNGLQRSPVPAGKTTIEDVIFDAILRTKVVDDIGTADYIAGGRTDKGVHAVNNVISLFVNSRLSEDEINENVTVGERNFVAIINRQLPDDIWITSWAPISFDFSARFSCKSRHYNYIFDSSGLDVELMKEAASYLIGEHDFRNFSQAQLERQNTVRVCFAADIKQVPNMSSMCVFSIKASGFLYHQIRLTMAILALVGNKLEKSTIVKELLDVEKYPRRPSYKYANPDGLVLIDCEYENVEWIDGEDQSRFLASKIENKMYNMKIGLSVHELIKKTLDIGKDTDEPHRKITGIAAKKGCHKPVLDYHPSPNANDLLLKSQNKTKN